MARLVLKFGGTSVADLDRIRSVAQRIKREVEAGHQVAVVVSAMSGTTNQMVGWVNDLDPLHDEREYDTVVAAGEQITAGLTAIALQKLGLKARSWLGWQIPIRTDGTHGKARIESIETEELRASMADGVVAVVAGFQGVGPHTRISTLGRGGSDTSAVALAAALEADRCDIFTDVDGVYTTDPRIVTKARKMDKITYEEMLCASKFCPVLKISQEPWWSMRVKSWNSKLSAASPIAGMRRKLLCATCRISPAWRRPCSARWLTLRSTST
jgi:aspartate kinase